MDINRHRTWFDRTSNIIVPALFALIICSVAALTAGFVSATESQTPQKVKAATATGVVVRLFEEPCPVTVGWLSLKRAEVILQGEKRSACWLYVAVNGGSDEDYVHVIDDRLMLFLIPADAIFFEAPPI